MLSLDNMIFRLPLFMGMLVSLGVAEEASTETVKLSKKTCQQLIINHKTSDDVAYKPGVDVNGRAVVPADIAPSKANDLGKNVSISLEIPLKDLSPTFPTTPAGTKDYVNSVVGISKASVGKLEIKDNKVYINGQLVGDEIAQRIEELCRKHFPDL